MGQGKVLGRIVPNDSIRAGRMLAGGRLTVTMTSKRTNQHITLEFTSKKEQKHGFPKWKPVLFAEASHVFVKTNGEDRVGTYYPNSQYFYAARDADPARVWAAEQTLYAVTKGLLETDKFTLKEANYCGKCGRELTDPVSIERGLGPDCYGAVTGSMHQMKQSQDKKGRTVPGSFAELAARVGQ